MASSSSSFKYDVFLSFHGEDTRKTFVDHLYAALDRNNICTFKDDKRLEKGKKISDDLLESIENSRFYIIVFSKNYASSSWCLNELVKIMECHKKMKEQIAFPVFYDVEPSDVRRQGGLIGESIAVHESKNEPEVGKWKEALKDAANLSGWHLAKIADGHEAQAIKIIVYRVLIKLHGINMEVDENLVGMERRMRDLDSSLQIGSHDVRMIGIKGMGGSGKTTLAQALFDKICINFEAKSFVENVREKGSRSGLEKLQKQILEDVLKEKGISVTGVHEGKNLLKKKLKNKNVLIVLDDVDHEDSLEKLAGDLNWFKPGSRIIITTRDAKVLNKLKENRIYNIDLLSNEEAILLFSRHAFGRDNPNPEYETQSREVVRYAAGLPLTLKTLGSLLCGADKYEWEDVLGRLKTIPLKKTLEVLELSYESLDDDQKEIFLDVACFLRHQRKDDAIRVLESCGYHARNGLRVLEQKSLITVEERFGSVIRLHDHIIEMGENIVRRENPDDPNKHSRLWVRKEIKHVLANNSVSESVRCIYLPDTFPHFNSNRKLIIPRDTGLKGLRNVRNLRCLIVNYRKNINGYKAVEVDETPQYLPNSLRYLYFRKYPHNCLPETFEAANLVGFEMFNSNIEQLWKGGKVMKKLKFLSLGYTKLRSLDLGFMPNLERLHLEYCLDLVKIHVDKGSVKKLAYFSLQGCPRLKSFSFIHEMESLTVLRINQRPASMEPMIVEYKRLIEVQLSEKDVRENICSLQHLRTLHLNNNPLLETLPDNVQKLELLEELDLSGLYNLRDIPGSICKLEYLKKLNLGHCRSLTKLPDELGDLECLQELDLSNLSILRDIPGGICKLKHLKKLNFRVFSFVSGRSPPHYQTSPNSRCLEKLPDRLGDLECLQELDIQETAITRLPHSLSLLKDLKVYKSQFQDCTLSNDLVLPCSVYDFEKHGILDFQHLRTLKLGYHGIAELTEALGQLECLEELDLSYTKVKRLPDSICMLKHLKVLDVTNSRIEEVPEALGDMECLEELDLGRTDVKHLPESICMLKRLKTLSLWNCVHLEKLPNGVGQLESLEVIYLSSCYSIREIPSSVCMLKRLKSWYLDRCFCLEKLPEGVGQLESLEELDLSWCYSLREIPSSICMLKHLKKLKYKNCRMLEKLQWFQLSNPKDAGITELEDCIYLESLHMDIHRLESLAESYLSYLPYRHELDSGLQTTSTPIMCSRPKSIYLQKFLKMYGFTFYTRNPDERESVDSSTDEECELIDIGYTFNGPSGSKFLKRMNGMSRRREKW